MSWRSWGFAFLQLLLSLWLTISLVFFLSRLLPAVKTPKGLMNTDLALYGGVSAETIADVTADYRTRTGLNLPFFYVSFSSKALLAVPNVAIAIQDRSWMQKAILWKGEAASLHFYTSYLAWQHVKSPAHVRALHKKLGVWASSADIHQRNVAEESISFHLRSFKDPASNALLTNWQNLRQASSSFSGYLPVVRWHGAQNAYHQWILHILAGDLGASVQDYQPVTDKLQEAGLVSFSLALLGLVLGVFAAYVVGVQLALHPSSGFSHITTSLLYLLDSIPSFLIALGLFAFYLVWVSQSTFGAMADNFHDLSLLHLWGQPAILMGCLCIALLLLPHLTLQFSRSLLDQTKRLYFRTALAKGLSVRGAIKKHAVPNALVPSLTLLSEMVIGLMSGVLVIEITFSLPGIGSLLTNSILTGDYPVLIGLTLFFLLFRVLIVWLTDCALLFLDPRMRNEKI